jgi:hypothetical protein
MKYLEELNSGSIISIDNKRYIISNDFRLKNKQKQRMCISIENGLINWFGDNSIVEHIDLYYRDYDGNILPLNKN